MQAGRMRTGPLTCGGWPAGGRRGSRRCRSGRSSRSHVGHRLGHKLLRWLALRGVQPAARSLQRLLAQSLQQYSGQCVRGRQLSQLCISWWQHRARCDTLPHIPGILPLLHLHIHVSRCSQHQCPATRHHCHPPWPSPPAVRCRRRARPPPCRPSPASPRAARCPRTCGRCLQQTPWPSWDGSTGRHGWATMPDCSGLADLKKAHPPNPYACSAPPPPSPTCYSRSAAAATSLHCTSCNHSARCHHCTRHSRSLPRCTTLPALSPLQARDLAVGDALGVGHGLQHRREHLVGGAHGDPGVQQVHHRVAHLARAAWQAGRRGMLRGALASRRRACLRLHHLVQSCCGCDRSGSIRCILALRPARALRQPLQM